MASAPYTAGQAAWPRLIGATSTWREALRAGLGATFAALRGAQHAAHQAAEPVKEKLEGGAVSVAEGAVKAATLPADIARALRRELDDAWSRASRTLAEGAAMAVLGVFALVVLTVGLATLLDALLGEPWGTLLVGLLHAAGAGAVLARRKARARREAAAATADAPDQPPLAIEHPAALRTPPVRMTLPPQGACTTMAAAPQGPAPAPPEG